MTECLHNNDNIFWTYIAIINHSWTNKNPQAILENFCSYIGFHVRRLWALKDSRKSNSLSFFGGGEGGENYVNLSYFALFTFFLYTLIHFGLSETLATTQTHLASYSPV